MRTRLLRKPHLLVPIAVIVGVVFLAFGSAVPKIEFLSDDWIFLDRSTDWSSIIRPAGSYHLNPVLDLYFAMLRVVTGAHPGWCAFANVLLHSVNALLLFRLSRLLNVRPTMSLAAAVLYGSHFLIAEAVFWITGAATLLMMTFYLLSLNAYVQAVESPTSWRHLALSFLFGILCIFTIESGITVFVTCLVYDLLRHAWGDRKTPSTPFREYAASLTIRALGGAACASLLLLSKMMLGSRMTVSEHPSLRVLPGLIADYFLRIWIPYEPWAAMLLGILPTQHFFPRLNEKPMMLAIVLLVCVIVPASLALWRGSVTHRFVFVWAILVVGSMSFGAGNSQSRYFAIVGAPGSLLFATSFDALTSGFNRRLRELILFSGIGSLVLGGILYNQHVGQKFIEASLLTRSLLNSPVLIDALSTRAGRKIVVLNLPDHQAPEWSAISHAHIFRNGFSEAVKFQHGVRFNILAGDVSVRRLPGFDLSRNVWHGTPLTSDQEIQEMVSGGSSLVLQYQPESRNFAPLESLFLGNRATNPISP